MTKRQGAFVELGSKGEMTRMKTNETQPPTSVMLTAAADLSSHFIRFPYRSTGEEVQCGLVVECSPTMCEALV